MSLRYSDHVYLCNEATCREMAHLLNTIEKHIKNLSGLDLLIN